MRIQARIDARYASDEFKAARRDLNHRTKDGLTRAGEKVALPDAKHNAAHLRVNGVPVGPTLYVRSTQRTAYLASRMRGKANRAVGLLEFGGVVRTEIKPRKAQALYFGGRFAANVKTPRHYRGQHFLSRAVSSNTNRIADAIADEVVKAFNGFEVHR
jgi:hypothetical protein